MKRTTLAAWAVLICAAGLPAAAELDRPKLIKHIRITYSIPPGTEITIKEIVSSPIKGYKKGTLEIQHRGRTIPQTFLLSEDDKRYVMTEIFTLGPAKEKGFLAPKGEGARAPDILVSQDGKHLVLGTFHDASVDLDEANRSKLRLKDAAFRGPKNAPVTVVEFSDLQCPFCRDAHLALEKELLQAYPKDVRWVFKHYPLTNIHPWAMNAAIAASCGVKIKPEAGFKLEKAIFDNQAQINGENLKQKLLDMAKESGLDAKKFEACYDKQETKDAVMADIEEGNSLGVDGTPAFFINGRKHGGWDRQKGFENMKTVVDEMLKDGKGKG